jgi:hypothetical protein
MWGVRRAMAPTLTNDDNILFEPGQSETARLALQHEIIKYGMKDLVKALIDLSKPGLKILDQATADGKQSISVRVSSRIYYHVLS